jgi:uncharacterized membrane protein YgdD (TMEM256/DUF423 family)
LAHLETQKWALITTALAGLAGAGGVILSAVGAHVAANPLLDTASSFLLIHAIATLAVSGLTVAAPQRGAWFLGSAILFLLGSLLFCSDLSMRALTGGRLFPMAAPIGGTLLILGWVWVFVAALAALSTKRA